MATVTFDALRSASGRSIPETPSSHSQAAPSPSQGAGKVIPGAPSAPSWASVGGVSKPQDPGLPEPDVTPTAQTGTNDILRDATAQIALQIPLPSTSLGPPQTADRPDAEERGPLAPDFQRPTPADPAPHSLVSNPPSPEEPRPPVTAIQRPITPPNLFLLNSIPDRSITEEPNEALQAFESDDSEFGSKSANTGLGFPNQDENSLINLMGGFRVEEAEDFANQGDDSLVALFDNLDVLDVEEVSDDPECYLSPDYEQFAAALDLDAENESPINYLQEEDDEVKSAPAAQSRGKHNKERQLAIVHSIGTTTIIAKII